MTQPPPKPTTGPAIWQLVIADMQARDQFGREKYGTPLQAHNGRDALRDAYDEALDLCVYLRQAIEERSQTEKDAASWKEVLRLWVECLNYGPEAAPRMMKFIRQRVEELMKPCS